MTTTTTTDDLEAKHAQRGEEQDSADALTSASMKSSGRQS